uniref:Sorting nexin-14 n=1 Tax=Schistocephalus solidus TaxID=70667 RepID=A0A0X3PK08_SCHSO
MMVAILIILLFFLGGYLLSSFLRLKSYNIQNGDQNNSSLGSPCFCRCGIITHSTTFFDPRIVKLPYHINENLQKLFDLTIERFISSWFNKLSDDPQFPSEIKLQFQHLCSALLLRLDTVDIPRLIEEKILCCVVHHVEHLLILNKGQHGFDESSEPEGLGLSFPSDDEVLHQLYTFNYLHPAMLSRQSESAYLRGVVQKLLPHLLIPPILAPPSGARRITGTQAGQNRNLKANNPNFSNLAYVSAQFYHQLPKLTSTTFNTKSMTEGDTRTPVDNCAFSFLTELLANHVLLPALDSVANPDSINTVLLYLLDPPRTATNYPAHADSVPLLNQFIEVWFQSSRKPTDELQLEALLQQPEELANFVQYMKSINCSASMTALLLMFELVNTFANNSVSEELCARLRVPLHQLLLLLHCGRVIPDTQAFDPITRPLPTQCSDCQHLVSPKPQLLKLLNMPPTFTNTIQKALSSSDPLSIARLVNAPEWISSYAALRTTFQSLYLPAYLESVNYLERKFAKDADKDDLSGRAAFEFLDNDDSNLMEITNTLVSQRLKPPRKRKGQFPLSNSFTDLKELTGRSGAGGGGGPRPFLDFFRDDLLLDRKRVAPTAGGGGGGPKPSQPRAAVPKFSQVDLSSFADDHDHDIDFADWSVTVPSYCRPTADRSHYPLLEVRTPRGKNFNQVPMNSSALDLSLLNFTPSRQGFYLIQSERGQGEMRMVVYKVHRKYAEFYVLEQKLLEFHGSAISVRLPPKRNLGSRAVEFLERSRPRLEKFLQYLIGQPFLRSSELLFAFLTSPMEFTNNILPEINLGKLVKSFPLLLAKEVSVSPAPPLLCDIPASKQRSPYKFIG